MCCKYWYCLVQFWCNTATFFSLGSVLKFDLLFGAECFLEDMLITARQMRRIGTCHFATQYSFALVIDSQCLKKVPFEVMAIVTAHVHQNPCERFISNLAVLLTSTPVALPRSRLEINSSL